MFSVGLVSVQCVYKVKVIIRRACDCPLFLNTNPHRYLQSHILFIVLFVVEVNNDRACDLAKIVEAH